MMTVAEMPKRSWVISDCTRYWYSLTQEWGAGERSVTWVMLNPSTVDDPTTRRVGDFSRRWHYDRLEVVNLFAFRTVEPQELSVVEDPVGPKNRWFVRQAVNNAELVVVAWGDGIQYAPSRPETLDDLVHLRRANTAMLCFGLTKAGHPLHPAQLPDSMIPVVWMPR